MNLCNESVDENACLHMINDKDKYKFFLQYRGKETDKFVNALKRLNAPCKFVLTTRKLKTVLPSLKPSVPGMLLSKVVYKLDCPGCNASYVGQTVRHAGRRLREHLRSRGIMTRSSTMVAMLLPSCSLSLSHRLCFPLRYL